jgi:two-component system OmpR family response regulator
MLVEYSRLHLVNAARVLLIEDEQEIGETLIGVINRAGMTTAWAKTGPEAVRLKPDFKPDVVLVDLNLPETDGIALVSWLCQQGDCGVIVVSGMGDEADRILGLELGADDYIAKPPQLRELVARIRAVYRRVRHSEPVTQPVTSQPPAPSVPAQSSESVTVGKINIDVRMRAVTNASGQRINLTAAEFAALEAMLAAKGQPVSRDEICKFALHRQWRAEDRSVDQLIFNLRNKLCDSDAGGRLIHSIRGAGYLLAAGGVYA